MTIYEALNWIKESDDTPYGYLIFNNKPEGQLKGIALKTIYEAAKNDELVPVELFNQIKKERDEALKNLEAIKQDPRWIPVSEDLPEDIKPVQITWKNNDPEIYYQDIKGKHFTGTAHYKDGKWYWYSDVTEDLLAEYGRCDRYEFDSAIEVVAWMPLPEPYKERK